jgi:hypothetical protein
VEIAFPLGAAKIEQAHKQKGPAQWPALLKIPDGRSRNGGHVSVILMLP